ncbi:MAG: hypothetical protein ACK5GV_01215 [Bacteroidota bacterium]
MRDKLSETLRAKDMRNQVEFLKSAIEKMSARLNSIEMLITEFQPGGRFHELAELYTKTMRIDNDAFWASDVAVGLSRKLDSHEAKEHQSDTVIMVDNPGFDAGLEYNRKQCQIILEHLKDKLSEIESEVADGYATDAYVNLVVSIERQVEDYIDDYLRDDNTKQETMRNKLRSMLKRL